MLIINATQLKTWLEKGLIFALIAEFIYLVLFNLALNLPLTQTLVNNIKPDKFQAHWEDAWTWYPFRVHARRVSVNGQSRSQQWQVELQNASASIALLPLVLRKVKIYDLQGIDIEYYQRPRLKPDKDFSKMVEYFPSIRDREINTAVETSRKKRKPWIITLGNIVANGNHKFWVYHLQGTLQGEVHLDLSFQTQGGPFSASNGQVDIILDSLFINGDQEVLKQSYITGTVEVAPILFAQNKGIKSLAFISLDTEISAEVGSLEFLNLYLQAFKGMNLDGKGQLSGHLRFDKGKVLTDTHLKIAAKNLSMALLEHKIEGDGAINLDINNTNTDELKIEILFTDLDAFTVPSGESGDESGEGQEEQQKLFSGNGLSVVARGSPSLFPLESRESLITYLGAEIPSMKIIDLGVYQRYIPDKWRMKLYGGQGELQAKVDLSASAFRANLKITSTDADVGVEEHRFSTDLELGLNIDVPSFKSANIDVSGSYLRFAKGRLLSEEGQQSEIWHSDLLIDKGNLKLHLPEKPQLSVTKKSPETRSLTKKETDIKNLSEALRQQKLKNLLAISDAELKIKGNTSQIEWLNLLLKNTFNMTFSGSGQLAADLRIISGWLATGSQVEVKTEPLQVRVLDYLFSGDGVLKLEVEQGGASPDVKFNLQLTDALFKRHDEEQAFIADAVLKLYGLGKNMSYKGPGKDLELHMQIPSAKIKDMSVYNLYLPKQSLLQFSGGKADLSADIRLKPEFAEGFVKLKTEGLIIQLDEQYVAAELNININLANGTPANMDFDISGSSILLDKVRVIGEHKNYNQSDWSAKIHLNNTQTIWKKPFSIHSESVVEIKDSRPLVAMLSNQREKHGWLSKLLTIEDIQGTARLDIEHNEIVIPYVFFDSDKIDLGAKGIINEHTHEGVFYARFKKLKGLLKVRNGQRNFDILKAKKKFDDYSPVIGHK